MRLPVNHLLAINDADDKARDIVFAFRVKAGHLGRLAAEQHTTIFTTTRRNAFDDARDHSGASTPVAM